MRVSGGGFAIGANHIQRRCPKIPAEGSASSGPSAAPLCWSRQGGLPERLLHLTLQPASLASEDRFLCTHTIGAEGLPVALPCLVHATWIEVVLRNRNCRACGRRLLRL
jgi:hypothetical protein